MTDQHPVMNPGYLQGDIECKFMEYEVAFLNECLDTIQESHPSLSPAFADPDEVALFESIEKKITELYQDHCVKYSTLPPTLKEQALEALKVIECEYVIGATTSTIRRALEALPND
jgi:hypothetical protein